MASLTGCFEVVLFDLDGTLSDSAPGIIAALRHAFAINGLPKLDAGTERHLLGPPFYESLPPLLPKPELLPLVVEAYREHYAGGSMYDTVVYPGMGDVLARAAAAGMRMAVATSKPERFAVPIVERLGLAEFFETIGGDEPDGSLATKALVIDKVLARLGRPAAESVVMVGDRRHDVVGADVHGIGCIGAGWGYAAPGELERAGATPLCGEPSELLPALGLADAPSGLPSANG